jgi:hypothetical protein
MQHSERDDVKLFGTSYCFSFAVLRRWWPILVGLDIRMSSRPCSAPRSCSHLRLRIPLYIDSSSNIGVLGKQNESMQHATHIAAHLSPESFAAIFESRVVAQLALILHGEAHRRQVARSHATGHNCSPKQSSPSNHSAEPSPPDDSVQNRAAANSQNANEYSDVVPDVRHFFIYQGRGARTVLSASNAPNSPQKDSGNSHDLDSASDARTQYKCFSPSELRSMPANSGKRVHSAGRLSGICTAAKAKQAHEVSMDGSLGLPNSLIHSELHDSKQCTRSTAIMELMTSVAPGPIAADASNSALITDEMRLEVVTAWGVPALPDTCDMGAQEKKHSGAC